MEAQVVLGYILNVGSKWNNIVVNIINFNIEILENVAPLAYINDILTNKFRIYTQNIIQIA